MSVLLGFSDMVLAKAGRRQNISKDVLREFLLECHRRIEVGIVFGKAHERDVRVLAAIEAIEIILDESAGDLTCAIGTEVEEDDRIALFHATIDKGNGDDELVGDIVLVRSLHCLRRSSLEHRCRMDNRVVRKLHALPTVIAVHRIISAAYRCNTSLERLVVQTVQDVLQLNDVSLTAFRRNVTPVHEAMDEHLRNAMFFSCADKPFEARIARSKSERRRPKPNP